MIYDPDHPEAHKNLKPRGPRRTRVIKKKNRNISLHPACPHCDGKIVSASGTTFRCCKCRAAWPKIEDKWYREIAAKERAKRNR